MLGNMMRDNAQAGRAMSRLFMDEGQYEFTERILLSLMDIFSVTVEVFLRSQFGERYFSTINFSIAFIVAQIYAFGAGSVTSFVSQKDSKLVAIAAVAFLLMSFWHRFVMRRRSKKQVEWHSRCNGLSWGIWRLLPFHDDTIKMYFEPLVCFVVSIFLLKIDTALAAWIGWAGVALFIKEQILYANARNKFLDAMDAMIESKYMNDAMVKQKQPKECAGFAARGANNHSQEQREDLAKMFGNLSPDLQDMVTECDTE